MNQLVNFIASISSLVLSCVATVLSIWFWYKSRQQNSKIESNIHDNSELIKQTTDLMRVSQQIGLLAAHPNRREALAAFHHKFLSQKRLIIIGSSLKGVKESIDRFDTIIANRVDHHLVTRFLLTHPCYSPLREEKEGRGPGEIHTEIESIISELTEYGISSDEIRLYLGTPTVFCIITEDAMILNPYPNQLQSFQSFCLDVARLPLQKVGDLIEQSIEMADKGVGDKKGPLGAMEPHFRKIIDPNRWDPFVNELTEFPNHDFSKNISASIYGQYYWYHYMLPWYSRFSISLDDYRKKCAVASDGSTKVTVCANARARRGECFIDQVAATPVVH